jgi:hypothetical protein
MYKKILTLLVLSLLLSACAAPTPSSTGAARDAVPSYEAAPQAPAGEYSSGGKNSYTAPLPQEQRIVIRNADISLVVNNPDESMQRIISMAESMGGYVVNANMYRRNLASGVEVPEGSLTVRVPAERLDEALERIEAEGSRPATHRNISSQDVTSAYVDLQSRLRNLEAAEVQLQSIMNDARKTDEVLQVYNELTRVREQIEVIKGQIQYYDQASALSSISISLVANEAVQPITIAGWEPSGVARSAVQALVDALQVVAKAGIWMVLFLLPLLAVLSAPVVLLFLAVRAMRRRNRQRPLPPAASA